jgi:protein-disulfide isomerase
MRVMTVLLVIVLGAAASAQPAPAPAPRTPPKRPQPDPAATYAVPLDDSPSEGPAHAKVTIVMGMEFACPFCRRAWDTLAEVRKQYGDDVRIVYKSFVVHAQPGTQTALAACAAHKHGKWRAMAEALWAKAFDARDFDEANLLAIGRSVGLDPAILKADMHGAACAAELLRDMTELTRLGQNGTPTFWINGRIVVGAQPLDRFTALVDEEKKKADAAIARGVKLDDYYDSLLASGLRAPR